MKCTVCEATNAECEHCADEHGNEPVPPEPEWECEGIRAYRAPAGHEGCCPVHGIRITIKTSKGWAEVEGIIPATLLWNRLATVARIDPYLAVRGTSRCPWG